MEAGSGGELPGIIAGSLVKLADQRRGALLVFPGKEPVQEWLSGGYDLDAAPSYPLMMSIFDPNSPGHDGALVIRDGKFARFGTRLPISQSARLSDDLGTRHHAAMGLSERSDALVLAVSEERGVISAFQNGRLHVLGDQEAILSTLKRHWQKTATSFLQLPRNGLHWPDAVQIGASMAVAVVFWITLTVTQGAVLEKIMSVPVEFTGTAPGLTLVGENEKEVRLHLAGSKSALGDLSPQMMPVKIDLSKAGAGKQTFLISDKNIRVPRDVKLVAIVPPSVELTLATIVKKDVTILPQLIGTLPQHLKLKSVDVFPSKITALVPHDQEKDDIASVITTPIYLETITGDTVIHCKIIAKPSIQPVDKRWPDVEVRIQVKQPV